MELNQPKVSVIMSCFNSEKYVDYAIKSVIKQIYVKYLVFSSCTEQSDLPVLTPE